MALCDIIAEVFGCNEKSGQKNESRHEEISLKELQDNWNMMERNSAPGCEIGDSM